MALLRLTLRSTSLKTETHLNVLHPVDVPGHDEASMRTLVLLHGMLDGCDTWLTHSAVCRLAAEHDLMVVMPDAQRSFYLDLATAPCTLR